MRCWCWPGDTGDSALIRQARDDMREWTLARIIWVGDRGFSSAQNRRHLMRAGGAYILGEKLRSAAPDIQAALARQGRYRQVAENMHVKEVRLADVDDRMVICYNPEAAIRDAAIRDQLLTQLEQMIDGTDALSATDRARLAGVISDQTRAEEVPQDHRRAGCCASIAPGSRPSRSWTASSCSAAPTPSSPPRTSPWATSSCSKSNAAGGT